MKRKENRIEPSDEVSTRQVPWFRVLVEGIVIVGSILLAFGIEAWWDSSQDEARERQYLESLRSEFSAVQAEFPNSERQRVRTLRAHEALIGQMQGDTPAPADSLLLWISLTSFPISFDPPRAVFDDMISGGGTQLIQFDSLRLALAQYDAVLARMRGSDEAAWATWEQRIQPFLEGRIPRVDRLREGLFGRTREAPFGASRFSADFSGVLSDPAFEDMLAERWLRLLNGTQAFEGLSVDVDRIIELLESELDGG